MMLRRDRVDRVVDGALDHPMLIWEAGGAPPAGPGSVVSVFTAVRFQSVTGFAAVTTGAAGAGMAATRARMETKASRARSRPNRRGPSMGTTPLQQAVNKQCRQAADPRWRRLGRNAPLVMQWLFGQPGPGLLVGTEKAICIWRLWGEMLTEAAPGLLHCRTVSAQTASVGVAGRGRPPAGPALNSYGEFSRLAQRRRIDLAQARSSTESEVGHARSDSHSSVRTDFVLKPVRRAAHDAERDVPIAGDVAPGQVVRAPGTYRIWLVNSRGGALRHTWEGDEKDVWDRARADDIDYFARSLDEALKPLVGQHQRHLLAGLAAGRARPPAAGVSAARSGSRRRTVAGGPAPVLPAPPDRRTPPPAPAWPWSPPASTALRLPGRPACWRLHQGLAPDQCSAAAR